MNKVSYIFLSLFLCFFSSVLSGKEKRTKQQIANTPNKIIVQPEKQIIPPQIETEEENNLLAEFKTYNIGKNTNEGTVSVKDSIIEIVASGGDIWGNEDEGYFLFKPAKGDFEATVRVHSVSPVNLYTKAGIMARSDLSDKSKHVYFLVFPDNQERNKNNGGCEFQYREKRGGDSKAIYPDQQTAGEKFNVSFPETWIKLKREGNKFSASISKDNENWNEYSVHEQKMPKSLLIGLAVTSHDAKGYTRTEFSELQIENIE